MKVIGLTGNIACGKSSLAELLAARNIPVLDSDEVVQQLYSEADVIAEIEAEFGTVDKQELAALVFGDDDAKRARRARLEAILHPKVEFRFREWVKKNQNEPIIVNVLPLLFEAGLEDRYDLIITVTCDETTQLERLLARNPNLSKVDCLKRIKSQMSQGEKASRADFVLDNSGDLAHLEQELDSVLSQIS
ncbi:MAG: dephospho-CoA kinase [Candidatus Melainabacteria bacterium]|nr:dephospho-CoA kinase [Candidatus Melainabacteria bacterium]